jgi:hypothetical protein
LGEVDRRGGLEDSGGAGQEIVGTVDPLQQNIRDGEERHKGRRDEKRREGKKERPPRYWHMSHGSCGKGFGNNYWVGNLR